MTHCPLSPYAEQGNEKLEVLGTLHYYVTLAICKKLDHCRLKFYCAGIIRLSIEIDIFQSDIRRDLATMEGCFRLVPHAGNEFLLARI